jgi:hypothetical protein
MIVKPIKIVLTLTVISKWLHSSVNLNFIL